MKRETMADAISDISDKYLKEYFKMEDSFAERRAWRGGRGLKAAGISAAALLIFSFIIFMFNLSPIPTKPSGTTGGSLHSPLGCIFRPGMVCETTDEDAEDYYAFVFFSSYITNNINGKAGNFICFNGRICAPEHSFAVSDDSECNLVLGITEFPPESHYFEKFEPLLSEELSEVDLHLDGTLGKMDGDICFVFSIDEERFEMIKAKTEEHHYGFSQIELYLPIYWNHIGTASNVFTFEVSDVEFRE